MYTMGNVLKTDVDFDNAILFGYKIEVYQDGTLIDQGGVIRSHNKDSVRIYGSAFMFLKLNCDFVISDIQLRG